MTAPALSATDASSPHVFVALDGLRGIAALVVVILHFRALLGIVQFDGAVLAVDLFFAISGVVIAHAYEGSLRTHMSAATFMRRRLIRLYPLYALTTLTFAGLVALSLAGGVPLDKWSWPALARVLGHALLGWPAALPGTGDLYPLNSPAWSLLFEVLVNLAYAAGGFRLGSVGVAICAAAGGAAMIALTLAGYLPRQGFTHDSWPMGAARACFAFPVGVLIFRRWRRGLWAPHVAVWLPIVGFAGITIAVSLLPHTVRSAGLLGGQLVVCPLLVWLAAHRQPRRGRAMWLALGAVSYPLYLIHTVFLHLADKAARIGGAQGVTMAPWFGLACLIVIVPSAWAVDRWIDAPLRAWLRRGETARWWVRRGSNPGPLD